MGHFLNELDSVVVDLSVDQSQLDAADAIEFKDKAEVMFHNVNKALKSLHAAADKLDEAWSTAKITRVSGTSIGIVGGVLTIIGGLSCNSNDSRRCYTLVSCRNGRWRHRSWYKHSGKY